MCSFPSLRELLCPSMVLWLGQLGCNAGVHAPCRQEVWSRGSVPKRVCASSFRSESPRAPLINFIHSPLTSPVQFFSTMSSDDEKKQLILSSIRGIPDFPKKGILFWDVTTILLNPKAFQATIDLFVERYKDMKVDVVAGFEARGLIFGAPLALALGVAFVPLRKPGKLPGAIICESYITEYSTDKIEMHVGAVQPGQRVVLVDDLIATGGTLNAGVNLIKKAEGVVVEAAVVIELPDLQGRSKIQGTELFVLVEKEGL